MRLLLNRDPQAISQNVAKLDDLRGVLNEAQQRYDVLIVLPEERKLFDRFKVAEHKYLELQAQVMQLSAQNRVEEAAAILNGEMSPLADEMAVTLKELVELNKHNAQSRHRGGATGVYQFAVVGRGHDRCHGADYDRAGAAADP